MGAHTTSDDPSRYRDAHEVDAWAERPARCGCGRCSSDRPGFAEFDAEVEAEADELGAHLREVCRNLPDPDLAELFDHVYADLPPELRGPARGGAVMELSIGKALNTGLRAAMEDDPKVVLMGEDIGRLGGVFRVTDGLQKDFGDERVMDTPLAESAIVGTAVGLTYRGFRPVVEIQFDGFVYPAYDQIVNQVARLHFRSRARVQMPIVIRIPYGGGIGAVEHHSESPEAQFVMTPGLTVVSPSEPARRVLDDPAGHRLGRPGRLPGAEAALLGHRHGRRRAWPGPAPEPGRRGPATT